MLFLGSLPEMNVTDAAASFVQSIIQRSPVKDLLQPDSSQPAVRKLVVTWLLACPNKSEEVLRQRLNVVSTTRLTEALPLALQVATGEPQFLRVTPLTKAVATLIVGQLGSRADVERLEPLLEDSTVCLPLQVQAPGQPATSVQVRDVALVVLLHLTDQDPPDYGYTKAIMGSPRTFQLQNLYCENDQQRSAAIAKWRAWRAAHKDEFKSVKPSKSNDTSAKK